MGAVLEPLIRVVESAPESWVDEPVTTLDAVKRGVAEAIVDQLDALGPERFVVGLFAGVTDEDLLLMRGDLRRRLELRRRDIMTLPAASSLMRLIAVANQRVRHAEILIVPQPEHYEKMVTASSALARAQDERGERRFHALCDALRRVSENVYQRYLRALWVLDRIIRGKPITQLGKYGQVVNGLMPRLADDSLLFEPRCARVRNAIAHDGARYEPATRTALLSDGSWQERLTMGELEALAAYLLRVGSETYPRVLTGKMITLVESAGLLAFALDAVCALRRWPDLDAMPPDVRSKLERAGDEFTARLDSELAPLHQLLSAPTAGAA